MTPDELGLDVQIEVAATPEQVWEAISTGPGISAWFLPAEVEGERITFHHMPGGSSEAEVTDAEAPADCASPRTAARRRPSSSSRPTQAAPASSASSAPASAARAPTTAGPPPCSD